MPNLCDTIVLISGGGEMACALAHRLHRSHFRVCLTEVVQPLAVSRGAAFSEAVFDGSKTVEQVTAELAPHSLSVMEAVWRRGNIPILIDPECRIRESLSPTVLIDARSLKREAETHLGDAPLVIGLGPGFRAGGNCHVIVETLHSNELGRVILKGQATKDNRTPVSIGGLTAGRIVWAEQGGLFTTGHNIGDAVKKRQVIARLGEMLIEAPVDGMLRGLMHSGVQVPGGAKLVEIDPVNDASVCYAIRDKWRSVAGGVLEAIMQGLN